MAELNGKPQTVQTKLKPKQQQQRQRQRQRQQRRQQHNIRQIIKYIHCIHEPYTHTHTHILVHKKKHIYSYILRARVKTLKASQLWARQNGANNCRYLSENTRSRAYTKYIPHIPYNHIQYSQSLVCAVHKITIIFFMHKPCYMLECIWCAMEHKSNTLGCSLVVWVLCRVLYLKSRLFPSLGARYGWLGSFRSAEILATFCSVR